MRQDHDGDRLRQLSKRKEAQHRPPVTFEHTQVCPDARQSQNDAEAAPAQIAPDRQREHTHLVANPIYVAENKGDHDHCEEWRQYYFSDCGFHNEWT